MKDIPIYPKKWEASKPVVDRIMEKTGLPRGTVKKVIGAFSQALVELLFESPKFTWKHLGVISLTNRRAHSRFDIETFNKTGGEVKQMRTIPASPVINFCISTTFAQFLRNYWCPLQEENQEGE
jgi:hypothetical protein